MGSKPSGNTTQTQKLDPFVRDQTQKNINIADEIASRPYQPYTGPGVIGFNDNQQQAQQGLIGVANSNLGSQGWQGAADIAQGVAGSNPQQVQAQSGAQGMGAYQNPYQQQVVNNTLNDIDRSRQMAVQQGQDASLSAGAYDGSRSAMVDAGTNAEYGRLAANTSAQLNQQGFNTALAAGQQDASRNLQAQQSNQSAGLQQGQLALQAGGLLGNAGQQQYQNAINNQNLVAGVGDAQQGLAQQQADYARQEWETQQGYDERMLQLRNQTLNGSPLINAGSTTQQGPGRSAAAGALGGAAAGASMGAYAGPWGAGIGAGVGAGAGLLGII